MVSGTGNWSIERVRSRMLWRPGLFLIVALLEHVFSVLEEKLDIFIRLRGTGVPLPGRLSIDTNADIREVLHEPLIPHVEWPYPAKSLSQPKIPDPQFNRAADCLRWVGLCPRRSGVRWNQCWWWVGCHIGTATPIKNPFEHSDLVRQQVLRP